MLRRVRLVTTNGDPVRFIYYARNARLLNMQRVTATFDESVDITSSTMAVSYPAGIKMGVYAAGTTSRTYDFYLDVSENQPGEEAVAEITASKSSLTVYNENGVVICSNGVTVTASSSTSAPGETTSVPGEMTSVPGEEPGEMASETTDEPGAMI